MNLEEMAFKDSDCSCFAASLASPTGTGTGPFFTRNSGIFAEKQIRDAARVGMHLLAVAGRNILGKSHPEYANLAQVAAVGVVSGT